MKIKLLFAFLIVIIVHSKSVCQNCAVTDQKDPFTNQRILETDDVKLYGSGILDNQEWGFYFSLKKKDKAFFLIINAKSKYSNGTTKFDRVILKLSDNSLIDLSNLATEGSFTLGDDWRFEKSYSKIEKSDVDKLLNLRITNIRFVSNGKNFDAEISNSKANKIVKLVSCILSYQ